MLKLELEMPLLAKADVIVCGGGAAGVAAAIAAARNGADTVLVEKAGYAGGMMTGGLLPSIISMTDRRNMLAGGICREMVDELSSRMGVKADYFWQNINPELLKVLLDEMLVSSEVRVFFGL